MSSEYPVDTLAEMAAIPEEALPRFLAELPVMLGQIRRLRQSIGAVNEAFDGGVFKAPEITGATWTDDDKRTFGTTVMFGDGKLPDIEIRGTFEIPTSQYGRG